LSEDGQKQIDSFQAGGNREGLNFGQIRSFKIRKPREIKEQQTIAQALSDVDALIASLDKLIAKQRQLKTAAMQQLLTGKVRLPGFGEGKGYKQTEVGLIPEDWEVKFLPEVSWFQEGPGLRNWQFKTSGMKVINVTNLENGVLNLDRTDRYISIKEFLKTYSHFAIEAGDIVMASSGNSYSKTAVVRNFDLPLVMNTSVIRFKPINNNSYSFLLEYLKSDFFKDQIDLMITGGAQPNFGPYHLRKIHLPVPSLEEQSAIATVLSDMDSAIAALETRRAKTQAIKQGMMQELLTGRIRLI
jgi:type I restriction enzyme, S subunit